MSDKILYLVVPFSMRAAMSRKPGQPMQRETRVTGRVPRTYQQHRNDYRLISPEWDLGYSIHASSLNDLVSQCQFQWRADAHRHISGQALVERNNTPDNTDPTHFLLTPPPLPMAGIKLHELGPYEYNDVEHQLVVLTSNDGLHFEGTTEYRPEGFYYESTAFSRASHPELVTFVFQRMRELGFTSTEDETP